MRNFTAFIFSTVSLAALSATPAFSQALPAAPADAIPEEAAEDQQVAPDTTLTNADGQPTDEGDIVVTGSRLRRDNYSTPQNVDILTRNDQILAGTLSTSEALQSATVTSGTSQISGSFLGYLSEGGQAANTVGLRGLGSSRTLVLLNGRRLAPAGAGPQLVSADLNVLPTSIVQRIEILREGASSIYGSDAIAGVINIISDTKVDGITFDAFSSVPIDADGGRTYRASLTGGKTFDRGYITAAFEYREDTGMRVGDREGFSCPRELAFVNGVEVGQGSPDDPTKLRCFPFERRGLGTAVGYGIAYKGFVGPKGNVLGYSFAGRQGLTNNDLTQPPLNVNNYDLRPLANPIVLRGHVFSPVRTYTGFASGAYELGVLGDAEIYGEALFTRRQSHQDYPTQLNFQSITNYGEAQLYGGTFTGFAGGKNTPCAQVYGNACSPFFPTSFANAGINYFGGFIVPSRTFRDRQEVDFFRGNGGFRGDLGLGDWRYDANAMVSRTRSTSSFTAPRQEAVENILVAVPAPNGTPEQFITRTIPGQAVAPNTAFTCAANVTGGAYNGGTCVPIDQFRPSVFGQGQLSNAFYDYVYIESVGSTKYNQETFNLVFDGSLFALPGGDIQAAIGFEHRRDRIVDTPSAERQAGTLYGYGTAQITKGSDRVNEAFAEVQLPLLKDRPFFDLLELHGSARYTDYRSYGSDVTYALSGQWAPISNIRFRGNYSTNFRAPNLYEQFVADEVGFYPGSLDPCDEFGTSLPSTDTVYQNCLAELTPILDDPSTPANEALDYFTSGSIQVTTVGGAGVLEAEKAKTWGLGAVFTAPRSLGDLSLAVDYWNVKVKGQVATLGNLILNFCYQEENFPDNEYCQFIDGRNMDSSDPQFGQILSFQNPYLNIAQQSAEGIDFDARYATELMGGRFQTQLQATRNLSQKTQYFPGGTVNDFNGQLGYPGAGAGPKWVGSLDTRFTTGDNVTFRWGVKYVGRAADEEEDFFLTQTGDACTQGAAGCFLADFDLVAERYIEHGISVQWLWREVGQVTMGVNNLLNEKPPTISAHPNNSAPLLGNYFANGPYDYRGRSFFINVTRSF